MKTFNRTPAQQGTLPKIGLTYTQYPGCPEPSQLYSGIWEKIFDEDSVFFRTGGDKSNPFDGTVQESSLKDHQHTLPGGGFQFDWDDNYGIRISNSLTGGIVVAADPDALSGETRPINMTYQIWKLVGY